MKICIKNLLTKLVGFLTLTWWILLAFGMGAITKHSPNIEWLVVGGLIGGWILVAIIALISVLVGYLTVTGSWDQS